MVENLSCPVCARPAALHDVVDFNKSCEEDNGKFLPLSGVPVYYALCRHCGFLFAPQFQTWTDEDFGREIYNNDYTAIDPDHEGARPLSNADKLDGLLGANKAAIRHLDYGGGTGLLSQALTAKGWTSKSYDRFYDQDAPLAADESFDLITAFEVFEHAPDVQAMMKELTRHAHERTFIMFTTFTHDKAVRPNERINWWYVAPRNGHVSIYSMFSLDLLGRQHGWKFGSFNDYTHCFCKTVPDWAAQLISL
jgi:hypothetical protein